MLSWGYATEGVCVRGGPHVAKADNERVLRELKKQKVFKKGHCHASEKNDCGPSRS